MLCTFQTISAQHAGRIVSSIFADAEVDGDKPVSAAVFGAFGQPVIAAAMDNATLQSFVIAQNKAYTAVALGRDTIDNALRVPALDPSNFGDRRITTFPGGVVILVGKRIVGGVGVSGRKGTVEEGDTIPQDHELAVNAVREFLGMWTVSS